MGLKALEVYQGNDWLTYRWPVAQVFDTLDRVRDLCLQLPSVSNPESAATQSDEDVIVLQTERRQASHEAYEQDALQAATEEDLSNVFSYVGELCDDLSGEIDTVLADLFPYLQNNLTHRWAGFEMRLYLDELRRQTKQSNRSADTIIILAARIKALLKQIDQ